VRFSPFPPLHRSRGTGDRKKLRRALQQAFGASEEALDALLPPKGSLSVSKVSPPSRASVYSSDGVPLLVDLSGKGDFLPSLFALWRAPNLLPQLALRHADVAAFLMGGADLMLPGAAQPLPPDLRVGQLRAVYAPGNPCAVAVGEVLLLAAASDGRGRLFATLHHYGDCLCLLGAAAGAAPPPGFSASAVQPLAAEAEAGVAPELAALRLSAGEEAAEPGGAEAALAQEPRSGSAAEGAPNASAVPPPPPPPPPPQSAQAEMDALLDASLLQALRKRIKDRDLPLACGALLSAHLLPSRPAGSHLDVRKSSHKQLSRFLAAWAERGLLTLRCERGGEPAVTGVRRDHPALRAHAPHAAHEAAAAEAAEEAGVHPPLHAHELLMAVAPPVRALLAAAGCADPQAALASTDVLSALRSYLDATELDKRGSTQRRCLLDPLLCDALFQGAPGAPQPLPIELPTAELGGLLLSRCAPAHRLWRGEAGEAPPARRGPLPTVRLTHESRAKGKAVTVIARLEPFSVPPAELAAQLRERFAASCTVAELARPAGLAQRAATPVEVVLQGERAAEVAAFLSARWGVPAACVPLPPGVKPLKQGGKGKAV